MRRARHSPRRRRSRLPSGPCPREPGRPVGPRVVYVSPLKALAVDIWQNLERPLAEIADVAAELQLLLPRSVSRSGPGTPQRPSAPQCSERPPDSLITTLRVAVPAGRGRTDPRDAGAGPHGHRWTRSTSVAGDEARLHPWRSPSSGWSTWPRSRSSGSACPPPSVHRGRRPAPGRRGPRPVRPGRVAAVRDRGLRPPPGTGPGPRAARRRAGAVASAEQMDEILDLVAGHVAAAPDDAGVRQHPADGRAGRSPAGRAAR